MKTRNIGSACTRREFIRATSAVAAGITAFPFVAPSSVFGQKAPSKRVTMGIIGCGNQSTIDLPLWLRNDDCQIVAVCDVNRGSHGYKTEQQFLGREPQRDFVERHYARQARSGAFKGCAAFADFRELLARPEIDAVAIITPDHWHAIMTILAAEAGKDIYCQKPLTLTVDEGRDMIGAVRRHGRILQTGSQHRSNAITRRACELVRNGRLGELLRVETYVAENNVTGPGPGWKQMPVPDGFDYDRWLGPAPQAPYHRDRCFYRFRFIHEYSGGQTTNFGCHSNDIAHWAMGMDESGPIEIEDLGAEFPPKGDLFTTPTKVAFGARYANGVVLACKTDKRSFGATFFGRDGWLRLGSKGIEASDPSLLTSRIGPDEIQLPVSEDHYRNFLDSVKSRRDPIEPVETGHRTATVCHLGNIAMRLHRKIRWDPRREEVVGDTEAASLLRRPRRAPYDYSFGTARGVRGVG